MKKLLKILLQIFAGAVLGLIIGVYMPEWLEGDGQGVWWAGLAALPLVMFVSIGIHELGHAWFAVRNGFQLRFISVTVLRWDRNDSGKFDLSLCRHFCLGGLTGAVPVGREDLRRRYLALAAGGPLFSCLVMAAALTGLSLTSGTPRTIFQGLVIFNGFMALFNMIPMTASGYMSDGAQIFRLLRGGDQARAILTYLELMSYYQSGMLPRDWPKEAISAIPCTGEGQMAYHGNILHYMYALDQGDLRTAQVRLEDALILAKDLNALAQIASHMEAAYFYAANGNVEAARQHWAKVPAKTMAVLKPFRLLSEGAIAIGEGRVSEGRAMLEECERTLPRFHRFSHERLKELLSRTEKSVAVASAH